MSHSNVLVVDLDGSLLCSDMLIESFWGALARTPGAALSALTTLATDGRAAFKAKVAALHIPDPALLPYCDEVLERITAHKAAGGRTALVTASDQALAARVAEHLALFDEVHGSDGTRNLKGAEKARFLSERFGAKTYDYIGDSAADLAIWADSAEAITVRAPQKLRHQVEAVAPKATHLDHPPGLQPYIKAMRPHQWSKNVLVFFPLIASHTSDPALWGAAFAAFIAFCLTASSVYLLNDLLDLSSDRKHPRKRFRPLAAGTLPILHGSLMAPALFLLGVFVALFFTPPGFTALLIGYFVITMAYSLRLKRMLIVDICTLAGLYTLRLLGGSVATGIELSPWLLAFSVFLFLSLAAVKRQAELVGGIASGQEKAAGRAYVADDLPIVAMMALTAGYVSVVVFALYLDSDNVRELYNAPVVLLGVCLVLIYWISRVVMLTHRGHMNDDPVVFALKDRVSRLCALVVIGITVLATLI